MNMHADEYAERRVMRETGSMRAGACNYGVLERRPVLERINIIELHRRVCIITYTTICLDRCRIYCIS